MTAPASRGQAAPGVAFELNGKATTLALGPEVPLLWALRDHAGLPGTHFGCGVACAGRAPCTSTGSRRAAA